jgi:hypothetical protein
MTDKEKWLEILANLYWSIEDIEGSAYCGSIACIQKILDELDITREELDLYMNDGDSDCHWWNPYCNKNWVCKSYEEQYEKK